METYHQVVFNEKYNILWGGVVVRTGGRVLSGEAQRAAVVVECSRFRHVGSICGSGVLSQT